MYCPSILKGIDHWLTSLSLQHIKSRYQCLSKVSRFEYHKSICKQILNHPVCEPYLRCLVCRLPSGLHRLSLSGLCRQLCDLINTLSFPSSAHVPRVFFGLSLIRTLAGFDKVCLICGAESILNQSVHKFLYRSTKLITWSFVADSPYLFEQQGKESVTKPHVSA